MGQNRFDIAARWAEPGVRFASGAEHDAEFSDSGASCDAETLPVQIKQDELREYRGTNTPRNVGYRELGLIFIQGSFTTPRFR